MAIGNREVAIQGNTLARQIRTALADEILSGKLVPGTRLKDNDVAALFGTSNTPVREALRELAEQGLVEMQPYRGCVVRYMDPAEVEEAYDVRQALEEAAVRRAVTRLTDEQLDQLEALVQENAAADAAGDAEHALTASIAFHKLIIEAAGNRTLSRIFEDLYRRVQMPQRAATVDVRGEPQPGHAALLAALRARDAEQAVVLTRDHIAASKALIAAALGEAVASGRIPAVTPRNRLHRLPDLDSLS